MHNPVRQSLLPVLLAASLLTVLYLLRNLIAAPLLETALERSLTQQLDQEVEVDIARLRGPWLTGISIHGLVVRTDGGGRLFEAEELGFGFFLPDFAFFPPLDVLDSLFVVGGRVELTTNGEPEPRDYERRRERKPNPVAVALALFPHHLELNVAADLITHLDSARTLTVSVNLSGATARSLIVELRVPGGQEALPWEEAYESRFAVTATRHGARIVPEPEHGSLGANAFVRGNTARFVQLGGQIITMPETMGVESVDLQAQTGAFTASLNADETQAGVLLDFVPDDPVRLPAAWLWALGVEPPVTAGPARLEAELGAPEHSPDSVVDLLTTSPRTLLAADLRYVAAELSRWRFGDIEQLSLDASGSREDQVVELHRFQMQAAGGFRIEGSGLIDIGEGLVSEAFLAVDIPSVEALRPWLPRDLRWTEQISGSLSSKARLSGRVWPAQPADLIGSLSGDFSFVGRDMEVAGLPIDRIDLHSRIHGGQLELEGTVTEAGAVSLDARAAVLVDEGLPVVRLEDARITVQVGEPHEFGLIAPALVRVTLDEVSLSEAQIRGPGGVFRTFGSLRGDGFHIRGSGEDLAAEVLAGLFGLTQPVRGTLSWAGAVDGLLDRPGVSLEIESAGLTYAEEPAELAVRIFQDETGVRIERLEAALGSELRMHAAGGLPVVVGAKGVRFTGTESASFELSGETESVHRWLPETIRAYAPDGRLTGKARLDGQLRELKVELELDAVDATRPGPGRAAEPRAAQTQGAFDRLTVSARIAEDEGNRFGFSGTALLDGAEFAGFNGFLSPAEPLAMVPFVDPENLQIEATVEIDLPLGLAPAYVPGLIVVEGQAGGVLTVSGFAAHPVVRGRIEARGLDVRMDGPIRALTALSASVGFEGRAITVEEIRGDLGGAPFAGSGWAVLPGQESEGEVDLSLSGENLLLYSDSSLRVRADADIRVSGSMSDPGITGALNVTEAVYRKNIPLIDIAAPPVVDEEMRQLFSLPGALAARTTLDLAARADRTIVVRNNVLTGAFSMDVQLQGTLGVPFITGRVSSDEVGVRLPVTTIDMDNVLIELSADSPFQPELQAHGSTRIRDHELFVRASGTVPTVEIQVSSSPPLPQDQVLLLLITGYSDFGGMAEGDRAVRTLGRFLGRQLIQVLFGDTDAERALIDRLDVAVGRQLSVTGSEVIEIEFRVDDRNWFLGFERDRFDDFNVGLTWRLWFD